MRFNAILRRGAAVCIAAVVTTAGAQVAHADQTGRVCTGKLSGQTIYGDLTVPAGANCVLDKVSVQGAALVQGNLVVLRGDVANDVAVGKGAFFRADGVDIGGSVFYHSPTSSGYAGPAGVDIHASTVRGNIESDRRTQYLTDTAIRLDGGSKLSGKFELTAYSDASLGDATVAGDVTLVSYVGDVSAHGTQIEGDLKLQARGDVVAQDVSVRGAATVSNSRGSTVIKDSAFSRALRIQSLFGTQLNRTVVSGMASEVHSNGKTGGVGNQFRGGVEADLATCFPNAAAKSVETDRCGQAGQSVSDPAAGIGATLDALTKRTLAAVS